MIIYENKMNLYSKDFLDEYSRITALTNKLNNKLGFPIFRATIDAVNSKIKVENRFLKEQNNKFRYSNLEGAFADVR